LRSQGIETLRGDLLDEDCLARLPEAPNVIFMAGMKFGSTGAEAATWAMNSYLPGLVARRFRRSRIIAFSTGNVYGLVPVEEGGSREADAPQPVGEYAMSCLGRERVFEHFSRFHETPMALIRLNYACDLRYGVLVDLAQQVWAGHPVDLTMGHFNTIWQGDANAMTLLAFRHAAAPPLVVNVTGPERLSVREVCVELGRLMNRKVSLVGAEAPNALLSDASTAIKLFGPPRVSAQELLAAVADWVMRGGATLGKPTHFESRDGRF
jgi:nucleoside-diphosphate-sugar epimerase